MFGDPEAVAEKGLLDSAWDTVGGWFERVVEFSRDAGAKVTTHPRSHTEVIPDTLPSTVNTSRGRNASPRSNAPIAPSQSPLVQDPTAQATTATPSNPINLRNIYAACAQKLADAPTASKMIPKCIDQYTNALTEAVQFAGSTAFNSAVHICFQGQPDGPRYLADQFGKCVAGVHQAILDVRTSSLSYPSKLPAIGIP